MTAIKSLFEMMWQFLGVEAPELSQTFVLYIVFLVLFYTFVIGEYYYYQHDWKSTIKTFKDDLFKAE